MEELLNKHFRFIQWSCRRNARNFGIEYDELLSSSLEKLWRMRNHFRFQNGDVGFLTWASVILKSEAIDFYRRKCRSKIILDLQYAHEAFVNSDSLGNINFLEHLTKFASRFTDYNLLQMKMDGYSNDEIQNITGLSLVNVKSKIHRMRQDLRLFSKTL